MKRDMLGTKPSALFFSYLGPAMCSTLFSSFYIITDTVMIGHGVGEVGLVALNLLMPAYSVFYALGYFLGIGGSVLASVAIGGGDERRARGIFTGAVLAGAFLGAGLSLLCSWNLESLAAFLGADDSNMREVLEYGRPLMASAWVYIFSPMLPCFLRGDGAPRRAMAATVTGSMVNVALDYLFIFPLGMGMFGAILATVLGNIISIAISASHFLGRHGVLRLDFSAFQAPMLAAVGKSGAASFLTELSSGVVVFNFNLCILRYLEADSLVVYSVISNLVIVVNGVLNGVTNAMQPLVSYHYGAREQRRLEALRKIGAHTQAAAAVLLYGALCFGARWCILAFVEPSPQVLAIGIPAVRLYFLSVFPAALNVYYSGFFQAVVRPVWSFVIGLLRGMVLCTVLVWTLPAVFGGGVIWLVIPLAEAVTAVFTLLFRRREREARLSIPG